MHLLEPDGLVELFCRSGVPCLADPRGFGEVAGVAEGAAVAGETLFGGEVGPRRGPVGADVGKDGGEDLDGEARGKGGLFYGRDSILAACGLALHGISCSLGVDVVGFVIVIVIVIVPAIMAEIVVIVVLSQDDLVFFRRARNFVSDSAEKIHGGETSCRLT